MKLTGRMTALSTFISMLAERIMPFFKVLRENKNFEWGGEQSQAFKQLKEYLHSLPTLARLVTGETLYLYISTTQHTVGAALVREENKIQPRIYFVNKLLLDAETRYSMIEKVAYAVIIAARKLRPYFDAHQVVVLKDLPLEKSLDKIERSGRLAKWVVELKGLGIKYQPKKAMKGQALADIFTECATQEESKEPIWQLLIDGSSKLICTGARLVLITYEGKIIEYALKFQFKATNNEV